MIEALISVQLAIELFSLSILFFIATKVAVLNDVSHQMLGELKSKR